MEILLFILGFILGSFAGAMLMAIVQVNKDKE